MGRERRILAQHPRSCTGPTSAWRDPAKGGLTVCNQGVDACAKHKLSTAHGRPKTYLDGAGEVEVGGGRACQARWGGKSP